MQLLPAWRVDAAFTRSLNSTPDGEPLLDRTQYRLTTTWSPTTYVSLGANWWVTYDNERRSANQSYNLSYTPGPKLSFTASHQEFGSGARSTSTSSFNTTYRFLPRLVLFATLSRSRSENAAAAAATIANFLAGLRLGF